MRSAVVPCCVFSKSNPQRRLRDGSAVVSHAQYCDYLEYVGQQLSAEHDAAASAVGDEKPTEDPLRNSEQRARVAVCRTELSAAFEGRNVVIYGVGAASPMVQHQ